MKTSYKFKIQITIVYVYENNIINKISKIRFNVTLIIILIVLILFYR